MTRIGSTGWFRLLAGIVLICLPLLACGSPVAQVPPPVPLAKGEVLGGVGLTLGSYKSDNFNPVERVRGPIWEYNHPEEQYEHIAFWGQTPVTERLTVGGVIATGSAIYFGPSARFEVIDAKHFALSAQARGGLAYFELGVPLSVEIYEDLWVYTVPSMTARLLEGDADGSFFPPGFLDFTDQRITGQALVGVYWTSPRGPGVGVEAGDVIYLDRVAGEHAPYVALNVGYRY